MDIIVQIFVGVICLGMIAAGGVWQAKTYSSILSNDESIIIYTWPLILGAVISTGFILINIFNLFFSEPTEGFFSILFSIIGFTIVWALKNFFGQFIVGLSVAWGVYSLYQFGSFDLLPIFTWVVNSLLFWAPSGIKFAYVIGSYLWFIISGLMALKS